MYPTPPNTISMLEKERGSTIERTISLEEPSLTITTCLKIDATCAHDKHHYHRLLIKCTQN
jgi:hypothetical protein